MKKIIVLLLVFCSLNIHAQVGGSASSGDARSVGMGRVMAVTGRGVASFGVNPANLAFKQDHNYEIKSLLPLPNISINTGTNNMTFEDFNTFFSPVDVDGEKKGKLLTDAEKEDFRALFEDDFDYNLVGGVTYFNVSFYAGKDIGAFGFFMNDRFAAHVSIPKDIFDIMLDGNEPGRMYELDDLDIQAWYLREYGISYAREITELAPKLFKQLNVGISLKSITGFSYAGIEQLNTTIVTDPDDYSLKVYTDIISRTANSPDFGIVYDFEDDDIEKESNAGPFMEPSGNGFGIDLGLSAEINDAWSAALSITDIGSISWETDAVEYKANSEDFVFADLTEDELVDSLKDAIKGEGEYIDGFSTDLATALKMGVSVKLDKVFKNKLFPLLAVLEYHQGFNNMPSNSTIPRVGLGFEGKPVDWLPVRTGFSFGGRDGFNWGFGVGFDAGLVQFDLATSSLNSLLLGNGARRYGVSLGSVWKF